MPTLSIRNLPDEVHQRLRVRAARNGRSMEAEAREILARATLPEAEPDAVAGLQDWVREIYGGRLPEGVVDELIRERRADRE